MRSLRLIWIGKTQAPFMETGINIYLKKLSNYIKVNYEEIKSSQYGTLAIDECRRMETGKILKRLEPSEINVFLDENGKRKSSIGLARWLEKEVSTSKSRVNFFIGGAYGFEKSLLPSGVHFLSLSDMTFTHQMVRLILVEQIYRAFTIIRGEPYHHT